VAFGLLANGPSFAGIAKFLQDQTVGKPLRIGCCGLCVGAGNGAGSRKGSCSGTAIDWVPRGRPNRSSERMVGSMYSQAYVTLARWHGGCSQSKRSCVQSEKTTDWSPGSSWREKRLARARRDGGAKHCV
jgi:hypothetical protein